MQIFFHLGDYQGNNVTRGQNAESKPHGVSQFTGEQIMTADNKR